MKDAELQRLAEEMKALPPPEKLRLAARLIEDGKNVRLALWLLRAVLSEIERAELWRRFGG